MFKNQMETLQSPNQTRPFKARGLLLESPVEKFKNVKPKMYSTSLNCQSNSRVRSYTTICCFSLYFYYYKYFKATKDIV